MRFPDDRRYTESHEWAMADDELVRIGITSFAVEQLGDIIYLDLPEVGQQVRGGVPFGEIESVKAVAYLNAPVSGEIVAVNASVLDDLDLIAEDPFGEGWMIAVAPADPAEMDALMAAEAYAAKCEEEA